MIPDEATRAEMRRAVRNCPDVQALGLTRKEDWEWFAALRWLMSRIDTWEHAEPIARAYHARRREGIDPWEVASDLLRQHVLNLIGKKC